MLKQLEEKAATKIRSKSVKSQGNEEARTGQTSKIRRMNDGKLMEREVKGNFTFIRNVATPVLMPLINSSLLFNNQ